MKTKLIDWIPFINWLSSFGEKLPKHQRMFIARVNIIIMLLIIMCIFGIKDTLIACMVLIVLGLVKPAIDLIKQVLN